MSEPVKKLKHEAPEDYVHVFVVGGECGKRFDSFMIPMSALKSGDIVHLTLAHGQHIENVYRLNDDAPTVQSFFVIALALGGGTLQNCDGLQRSFDPNDLSHKTADWEEYKNTKQPSGKMFDLFYFNNILQKNRKPVGFGTFYQNEIMVDASTLFEKQKQVFLKEIRILFEEQNQILQDQALLKTQTDDIPAKKLKRDPIFTAKTMGWRKCFDTRKEAFQWICDSLESGMKEDYDNKWSAEQFMCSIQKFDYGDFENSQKEDLSDED